MYPSLKNKVVLITGATSGIGKATAIAFAAAGSKVVISGRRETEGQAVVAEITAAGGEATFVKADVAVEAEVATLVGKTVEAYGRLDVAFNNAGVELTGAIPDVNEFDYQRVFNINVWGVLASMKYEIPEMLKQGSGSIINTSSVAGHIGMAGASVYVASKHAVEGLTKSAAMEYAAHGIRVNTVSPGGIETEMFDRFTGGGNEEALNYMRSLHPVGRMGRADEIAKAVLFLASDESSFVTGTSLNVDGGFLAR
ncbi:MAG: glucose 1-dehydrogenase [Verrucomicrobiales bacterium]|nr:glucose 1-dehydrogenase [Verrucomicrobiales bacterium]